MRDISIVRAPRQRFQSDPQFAALVKAMAAHIEACNFTPSEIREAAILASILYMEKHIDHPYIAIKDVTDWLNNHEETQAFRRGYRS